VLLDGSQFGDERFRRGDEFLPVVLGGRGKLRVLILKVT
jgi:hypothetical protein